MLFQTHFWDMELPSVRNVSCMLRNNTKFKDHRENQYHLFPWHCHQFFELQFFFNREDSDSDWRQLPQNTLQLFPPLLPHSCLDPGFEYVLIIQINPSFIGSNISSMPPGSKIVINPDVYGKDGYVVAHNTLLMSVLTGIAAHAVVFPDIITPEQFISEARSHYEPVGESIINGLVLSLLGFLLKTGVIMVENGNSLNHSDFQRLVERIVSLPSQKISMQDAAVMMHMSYSDFSRNFKQVMGCGYVQFCNSVRISEAQNLLLSTNLSNSEIAERLGFGSQSYFNRIFQQVTGCTPSQFRLDARRHRYSSL